ncbi:four-carbon acid sugar kinase family protein [Sulfitobacter sp. D35]|uniref:four-carbon acid sugar kinase family protein n=1 Tax=Sulfitobacter sp. D35 TaxID=3083252 RepID=UPI00296FCE1E|nr:four-carbon acid sugar kinase family protein [Sulfitobacter sp. D35]MDW4499917.1 four-carbon acid sugar kinase family protein [Sulfitobacter sp. D35]
MTGTRPLVAWYGDDFTGSAVVAEILDGYGIEAVLFVGFPDAALRARFADAQAIGIAGSARSQSPAWMDRELPPIFEWLKDQDPELIQYKVCSTMDSAPDIGSIGRAIEIGSKMTGRALTPVMFAAPAFRRYQAFGHLFASDADGMARIDRHGTMSRHPSTPIDDSDTRVHLSRQTDLGVGLVTLEDLATEAPEDSFRREARSARPVVSVDVIDATTEKRAAAAIWGLRDEIGIAVASQGLSAGLAAHWTDLGLCTGRTRGSLGPTGRPIAVVSGSQSPRSADQIAWGEAHGFATVAFDSPQTAAGTEEQVIAEAVAAASAYIAAGRDVIVHAARGPDDPRIDRFRQAADRAHRPMPEARIALAAAIGQVLARLTQAHGLSRVAIAGGDTSSHAATALGIAALTPLAAIAGGAALHTGHFADPDQLPIEIMLKGGQMGPVDVFGRLREGT